MIHSSKHFSLVFSGERNLAFFTPLSKSFCLRSLVISFSSSDFAFSTLSLVKTFSKLSLGLVVAGV
jgi:hypothetical protein